MIVAGCGASEDAKDVSPETRRDAIEPSPLVFPPHDPPTAGGEGGVSGTGGAATGGVSTGGAASGGSSGGSGGTGGSATIVADGVRQISQFCGDGAHDPNLEECDDGNSDETDLCTSNCQTRDRLIVPSGDASGLSRRLGYGRHPVAGSVLRGGANRAGGIAAWIRSGDGSVVIEGSLLDRKGNPSASRVLSASGGTPILQGNPAVSGLGDGSFVVLWNDLNGDGAELGVAMRKVKLDTSAPGDLSKANLSTIGFANSTTIGAQQDADAIWTSQGLVVAWLDTSNPATAPDVRFRTFNKDLSPTSAETLLAGSDFPETAVALAPFGNSFVAAYREADDSEGAESIVVTSGGKLVRIEPSVSGKRLFPGASEDRPAVAQLDAARAFVTFTVGTDPGDTGVAGVFRLWGAVVDLDAKSIVWSGELTPRLEPAKDDIFLSQNQPSAVSIGDEIYVSYRQEAGLASPDGDDLWLRRLDWTGTTLDRAYDEVSLYRGGWSARSKGDQQTPALGLVAIDGGRLPERVALASLWEDYGLNFRANEAKPDVAISVEALPLRRGPVAEKDCAASPCGAGEGPCAANSECAEGLVCAAAGAKYGYGAATKVCVPLSCANGALDAGEANVDCGGECGRCFECLDAVPFSGTADYCSSVCKCPKWIGDCDSDAECAAGLACLSNKGALVGLPSDIDLCAAATCLDGTYNGNETRLDCGGPDCLACVKGTDNYCSVAVPCVEGDGKCDSDAECVSGKVCRARDAALYGYPAGTGVCVAPTCEDRGASNTANFCSSACRCPDGLGECGTNADCLGGHCAPDRGIYYGLPTNFGMCEAPHCTDGLKNYDETGVDCGGTCGSECPACPVNSTFLSFEDPAGTWKLPDWAWGTASVDTSSDSTNGAGSLRYFGCGFQEIWTAPFPGSRFSIVGNELHVDTKFVVANSGALGPGAWLGSVAFKMRLPNGTETVLYPETHYYKGSENQWITLKMPISNSLRTALLGSGNGYRLEMALNRPCAGGPDSILVDNLRFSGDAVFRSDCESNGSGGSGGTGGSSTGGSGGSTGGSGGSAGGSGGSTGGAGGSSGGAGGSTGGSGGASGGSGGSTGGAGGSGGSTGGTGGTSNTATQTFDFEAGSGWASWQQPTTLSTTEKTHGSSGIVFDTTYGNWVEYISPALKANEISEAKLLLVDVKLPSPAPYNTIGGTVDVILECPSQSLWWSDFGAASIAGLPSNQWSTVTLNVPEAARTALASNATDCKFHFPINIWGNVSGAKVYADNLRFANPEHCVEFTQQSAPPFSLGMPVTPNGTAANPYPLCTPAQISTVFSTPSLWNKSFVLMKDIDLAGLSGSIGNAATPFTGSFDGQSHTVNHATASGTSNVGLFGLVVGDGNLDGSGDGYIHDVTFVNLGVSGSNGVGGVVGTLNGGRLVRVSATGTVSGTIADIGGLVGASSGRIEDSSSKVSVTAANVTRLGGVVGKNTGTVLRTSSLGSVAVAGTSSNVGGLVGESSGTIDASFSSAPVTCAASRCGGLVGLGSGTLSASESEGAVNSSAGDSVGGLVGEWSGGTLSTSFSGSAVDAAGSKVGGLVGFASGGTVTRSRAIATLLSADGSDVGGLVGSATGGTTISRSSALTGVETLGANAGGLVGSLAGAGIEDSYATGFVNASGGNAGGAVGASSSATITRVYSTGIVSVFGGASNFGRFGGAFSVVTTTSCLTDSDKNPALQSVGNQPAQTGIQPVTSAQLQNQSTYVGWDFTNIWLMSSAGAGLR